MTEQEERYIHFVSCIDDLNKAWLILRNVRQAGSDRLIDPAFQFALVVYAKPYRRSWGSLSTNYKLGDEFIPTQYHDLHSRILDARDRIHAHSDLTVKEAILHVSEISGQKYASALQNNISGTEELPNIGSIISMVEETLSAMYLEEKRLREALPITPDNVDDEAMQ